MSIDYKYDDFVKREKKKPEWTLIALDVPNYHKM
jgi:hypothetical protein